MNPISPTAENFPPRVTPTPPEGLSDGELDELHTLIGGYPYTPGSRFARMVHTIDSLQCDLQRVLEEREELTQRVEELLVERLGWDDRTDALSLRIEELESGTNPILVSDEIPPQDHDEMISRKFCLCSDPEYCLRGLSYPTRLEANEYRRAHGAPELEMI